MTGAGGSIGSELCRQIVKLKPNKLILLELNEYSLYNIYEELIILNKNLKIIPLFANVQDQIKLEFIFEKFKLIQYIILQLINMYLWLKKTFLKELKIMFLVR